MDNRPAGIWCSLLTLLIKWWTLIAPLADERRMWVFSKEKKIGRDVKDRIFL